jgi:RNA-binding protein
MHLGKSGTTKALFAELGRALDSHELLKVRVLRECPEELEAIVASIEKQLKANVVGKVGRILVLYRRNPTKSRIALPQAKKVKTAPAAAEAVLDDLDDEVDDDELDGDADDDDLEEDS